MGCNKKIWTASSAMWLEILCVWDEWASQRICYFNNREFLNVHNSKQPRSKQTLLPFTSAAELLHSPHFVIMSTSCRKNNSEKMGQSGSCKIKRALFYCIHRTRSGQWWSAAAAPHNQHDGGIPILCQTESPLLSLHPSRKFSFRLAVLCGGGTGGVGGLRTLSLKSSSVPLGGAGTSVNGRHSRGIKEPLHWFVFGGCLIDLSTYEWIDWPSSPARVDNGAQGLN